MNEQIVHQVRTFPKFPQLYQNVAIYCRVSTTMQSQLSSMANQASFLVDMINKHYGWRLVDIYLDFKSGSATENRDQFQRMLNDIHSKKIDKIITKSISRFGRDALDIIQSIRLIKDMGGSVYFDEENIDTASTDSELLISILSAYAEAENDSRRENQYWSIIKHLEDGSSEIYKRKCFGYKKGENDTLVILSSEATIVQKIYELYISGYSIIGIKKYLEENNILSPSDKPTWCKRTIEQILSNEKYTGNIIALKTYTQDGKRIENNDKSKYLISENHPAIIPKEIFDAVQAEKMRRTNITKTENGNLRKSTKYSSKQKINREDLK